MLDVKELPAFADVDARLPANSDVRIAVQLLLMQAYARGQVEGLAKGEDIARRHMTALIASLVSVRK